MIIQKLNEVNLLIEATYVDLSFIKVFKLRMTLDH